jgi:hypothetical protein
MIALLAVYGQTSWCQRWRTPMRASEWPGIAAWRLPRPGGRWLGPSRGRGGSRRVPNYQSTSGKAVRREQRSNARESIGLGQQRTPHRAAIGRPQPLGPREGLQRTSCLKVSVQPINICSDVVASLGSASFNESKPPQSNRETAHVFRRVTTGGLPPPTFSAVQAKE